MKAFKCDKCGKIFEGDSYANVSSTKHFYYQVDNETFWIYPVSFDLCRGCWIEVKNIIQITKAEGEDDEVSSM